MIRSPTESRPERSRLPQDSTCSPDPYGGRVNFKFESLKVKFGPLSLPAPPVGSGWFEVLYLDDELRLCKDLRGDLQVCSRRSA